MLVLRSDFNEIVLACYQLTENAAQDVLLISMRFVSRNWRLLRRSSLFSFGKYVALSATCTQCSLHTCRVYALNVLHIMRVVVHCTVTKSSKSFKNIWARLLVVVLTYYEIFCARGRQWNSALSSGRWRSSATKARHHRCQEIPQLATQGKPLYALCSKKNLFYDYVMIEITVYLLWFF